MRPRRKSRLFAVPSGLLLFVCMFLPAVESCGEVTYPTETPLLCLPYILGLAVAIHALISRGTVTRLAHVLNGAAIAFWALSTQWFAIWALGGHGLGGAALSLVASAWLLAAAIVRTIEMTRVETPPLPVAQVGRAAAIAAHRRTWALVALMVYTVVIATTLMPWSVRPSHQSGASHVDLDLSGLYGC